MSHDVGLREAGHGFRILAGRVADDEDRAAHAVAPIKVEGGVQNGVDAFLNVATAVGIQITDAFLERGHVRGEVDVDPGLIAVAIILVIDQRHAVAGGDPADRVGQVAHVFLDGADLASHGAGGVDDEHDVRVGVVDFRKFRIVVEHVQRGVAGRLEHGAGAVDLAGPVLAGGNALHTVQRARAESELGLELRLGRRRTAYRTSRCSWPSCRSSDPSTSR